MHDGDGGDHVIGTELLGFLCMSVCSSGRSQIPHGRRLGQGIDGSIDRHFRHGSGGGIVLFSGGRATKAIVITPRRPCRLSPGANMPRISWGARPLYTEEVEEFLPR